MIKTIKKFFILFCFILVLAGLIYFIQHPYFKLQKLEYQGQNFILKKSLQSVFAPLEKKNILVASLMFSHYKKICLKQYPQIEKISFGIKYPHYFLIIIKEKKPEFLLITSQKQYFIAEDGTLLNLNYTPIALNNADHILIIKGLIPQFLEKTILQKELLKSLKSLKIYLATHLSDQKLQIKFHNPNNLILLKDDILPIKIGDTEDLDEKFQNLKHFFKYVPNIQSKNIQYIDLRMKNKVIVKYWNDDEL